MPVSAHSDIWLPGSPHRPRPPLVDFLVEILTKGRGSGGCSSAIFGLVTSPDEAAMAAVKHHCHVFIHSSLSLVACVEAGK